MRLARALLLATAVLAAFLGVAATRTSQIITFTLGSTVVTLGTTTTTIAGLTLTTPVLGVATATSINKVAITAPATSATLTITDGQTLSYAEGSWSPTLIGSATPGTGQTYVVQVGSYEKIGRLVTARFYVQASSLGTAAGNIRLGNLPFTSTSTTNDFGTCSMGYHSAAGLAALNYGVMGAVNPNGTAADLQSMSNATSPNVTVAQAGASFTLIGVCNYRT